MGAGNVPVESGKAGVGSGRVPVAQRARKGGIMSSERGATRDGDSGPKRPRKGKEEPTVAVARSENAAFGFMMVVAS